MKKLQPFGDVPKKLTEQLRRSFVASRTFAQALLEGKQIVNKISKVSKTFYIYLLFSRPVSVSDDNWVMASACLLFDALLSNFDYKYVIQICWNETLII